MPLICGPGFYTFSQMSIYLIISIPFITALIGWLTNWVAVRMLFHPRERKNFLGISIQGLIPKRQADLANQTAEIIEKEIIQQHIIREAVSSLDMEPYLVDLVEKMVEERLKAKLAQIPFVGGFINDGTINMVKEIAVDSLKEELPTLVKQLAEDLESKIQIRPMVQARIDSLDLDQLEKIVKKVAAKEFRKIEQLGAILGFLIGTFQAAALFFTR